MYTTLATLDCCIALFIIKFNHNFLDLSAVNLDFSSHMDA